MSSTYNTVAGDTFESVARKRYGNDRHAPSISTANPGVTEPIAAGTVLVIPDIPDAPTDTIQAAPSAGVDEVAILINGVRFRFWEGSKITRSIDTFDTVELSAPFDPDAPGFRDTFRPFSYRPMAVTVGGEPLFTGTVISIDPSLTEDQSTLSVSGYSVPGVLGDCTMPVGSLPLEFNGLNLRDIARNLARPFGVSVLFIGEPGDVFDRVAMAPDKNALAFLIELAAQRGYVVASSPRGELVLWQSIAEGTAPPVAMLRQGEPPLMSVAPSFNPQGYYSDITGIEPASAGAPGGSYTVRNLRLSGEVLRPHTYEARDATSGNLRQSVKAKAARMYANTVSYSLKVNTWRDPLGALWEPNTFVKVQAPGAMIYEEYPLLIRSVEYSRTDSELTATLELVLPGAFNGELPDFMPWD